MVSIDERMKHRLVGIAVILSIGAMFLPAVLKRTQQPFDHLSRVAVRLPKKPVIEAAKVKDEIAVFKAVKVSEAKPMPKQEEPIAPSILPKAPERAQIERDKPKKSPIVVVKHQTPKQPIVVAKRPVKIAHGPLYSIQVASFTSLENANIMIGRLKARGYRASYALARSPNGQAMYKVLVGHTPKREEILKLKKELVARMDVYGFIVNNVG